MATVLLGQTNLFGIPRTSAGRTYLKETCIKTSKVCLQDYQMILTFNVNIRPAMHSCFFTTFPKNEKNHIIRSRGPRLFSKRLNYPEYQCSARSSDVNSVFKKTYSSHLSLYIHSREITTPFCTLIKEDLR